MNSYKKIRLIFLLIIVLPTVIFSIYQIGSYRKNEQVIESIYANQLDAILYSINQYSDNVVGGWAARMDVMCNSKDKDFDQISALFKNELPGISTVFQYTTNFEAINNEGFNEKEKSLSEKVKKLLKRNSKTIKKLEQYLKGGYRKIEPYSFTDEKEELLAFLVKTNDKVIVNVLVLHPQRFIEDALGPKIQEIAQEKFLIGVFVNNPQNVIYNSETSEEQILFTHSKPYWFFHDYFLGIELKDQTISDLVKSRTMKDIYAIAIIDLVLLLGAWIVYRNIKKQMELASLKSDFISNVSHEIRTPLALISMYIETLDMNRVKTEEKKKEYYSIIYNETQRLSSLVNKILNFSQIENEKRKYNFEQTNVNEVINEVVNTFRFHMEEKKYNLDVQLDESLSQINADREALADAIVNLIDNAIKYSGEDKSIAVKTGQQKEKVFIEIKDNGIGISESDQKKIFDKFYRVTEKNLAHKAKGSGLGLSIVKHIIDKHEGKIEVKSKVGNGTTFRLVFPVSNI